MKIFKGSKGKLIIILFIISIVLLGIVFVGIQKNNSKKDNSLDETRQIKKKTEKVENNFVGDWYSDRKEDGELLTLSKNGDFDSGDWFLTGEYETNVSTIILKNNVDKRELDIKEENGDTVLTWKNITFYRSKEQAVNAYQKKEVKELEEQKSLSENADKLLLGTYENTNKDIKCIIGSEMITIELKDEPDSQIQVRYKIVKSENLATLNKINYQIETEKINEISEQISPKDSIELIYGSDKKNISISFSNLPYVSNFEKVDGSE